MILRCGGIDREAVETELQRVLVTLIDLSLIGKHARWNVAGPGLRSLHLELDELIDAWRDAADAVGERIAALGGFPDGRARTVAARSRLPPLLPGQPPDGALVASLCAIVTEAVKFIRSRIRRIEGRDPATADLLHSVVATLETQLWMIGTQASDAHDDGRR
jgi:starvation-inducible DNA-binding protein